MSVTRVNYLEGDHVNIGGNNVTKTSDYLLPGFHRLETIQTMFGAHIAVKTFQPIIPKSALQIAERLVDFKFLDTMFSHKSRVLHSDLGIKRTLGYLFYGKQGSGKTTTINAIARSLENKYEACIFIVSSLQEIRSTIKFIEVAKKLKDFVAVIIFDECEYAMEKYENEMKAILDGLDTPDNIVFLCATNYIEKIPDTIKNRPSRFKYVIDISCFKEPDIIFEVVKSMNNNLSDEVKLDEKSLRSMTGECIGKTMDEIKHLFMDKCFETIGIKEKKEVRNTFLGITMNP